MVEVRDQWDIWFDKTKPVLPVMVISDLADAVPLANALVKGGIHLHEVTLRTSCALEAIEKIKNECPQAIVGAGSITNASDMQRAVSRGANFVLSAGISDELCLAAKELNIPYIPGVMTPSDILMGLSHGLTTFKFFPAEMAGGIPMLKALSGPFPQVRFCPTGGVSPNNYQDYLALDCVRAIGGSWMCSASLVREQNWNEIMELSSAI